MSEVTVDIDTTIEQVSITVDATIEDVAVTAATTIEEVQVIISEGASSIPVTNSDDTFSATANPPEYVVPDTTYNFYVGGNPTPVTETIPSLKDETFNIIWT